MKNAIIYTFVFLSIQAIAGFLVDGVWRWVFGKSSMSDATGIIVTTIVFTAITVALFLLAKWCEVSRRWIRKRPWVTLIWCAVAALGAIIPSIWIQEHMPELPNIVEDTFDMILRDRWGYVAIGLLAPFGEELVFRGAVLRSLLQWCSKPWVAIAISALLFAVAHMNPAQLPHAFLIGLLLGWMYYRTGSILPGMAYHWVNNSAAYVIFNLYPSSDIQLVDIFKGSEQHVLMAVGFSLLILLPALYQLHLWMKPANQQ